MDAGFLQLAHWRVPHRCASCVFEADVDGPPGLRARQWSTSWPTTTSRRRQTAIALTRFSRGNRRRGSTIFRSRRKARNAADRFEPRSRAPSRGEGLDAQSDLGLTLKAAYYGLDRLGDSRSRRDHGNSRVVYEPAARRSIDALLELRRFGTSRGRTRSAARRRRPDRNSRPREDPAIVTAGERRRSRRVSRPGCRRDWNDSIAERDRTRLPAALCGEGRTFEIEISGEVDSIPARGR